MKWDIASEFNSLIILVIIWIYSRRGSNLPITKNKMFQVCLGFTFIGILSNIVSTVMIYHYQVIPISLTWIVTTIYFVFTPLMGVIYYFYVITSVYTQIDQIKRWIKRGAIPAIAYIVLVLSNIVNGHMFKITPENGYERGDWLLCTYILSYLYCVLSLCVVIQNRKKIDKKTAYILGIFPLLATLIVIVQQMFPRIILSGLASSCALLIIYLYL